MAGRARVNDATPALYGLHNLLSRSTQATLTFARLVRLEHTIFALPPTFIGAWLAADALGLPHGIPPLEALGWIVVAMMAAWTAAMAFNRIADARYDSVNPRTMTWEIPRGAVKIWQAWAIVAASAALLVVAAGNLNRLCLMLSPVALAVVMGYSLTKRFTHWAHLVLGAANGLAPIGAWLGVAGSFAAPSVFVWAAISLWVGGFDVIYALQDVEVDRQLGIHSIPACLGPERGLRIMRLMHAGTLLCLGAVGVTGSLGGWYYGGLVVCAAILAYEHRIVRPYDLRNVNMAFQTLNGWFAVILLLSVLLDRW